MLTQKVMAENNALFWWYNSGMPSRLITLGCGICGERFTVTVDTTKERLQEVDAQDAVRGLYKGMAVSGLGLLGTQSEIGECTASANGNSHSADHLLLLGI
jgi:hypothetical protein